MHRASLPAYPSDRYINTLAPEVRCPGFPHPCRQDDSQESKDDAARRRQDAELERKQAEKDAAREAARAKKLKEEKLKAKAEREVRRKDEEVRQEKITTAAKKSTSSLHKAAQSKHEVRKHLVKRKVLPEDSLLGGSKGHRDTAKMVRGHLLRAQVVGCHHPHISNIPKS